MGFCPSMCCRRYPPNTSVALKRVNKCSWIWFMQHMGIQCATDIVGTQKLFSLVITVCDICRIRLVYDSKMHYEKLFTSKYILRLWKYITFYPQNNLILEASLAGTFLRSCIPIADYSSRSVHNNRSFGNVSRTQATFFWNGISKVSFYLQLETMTVGSNYQNVLNSCKDFTWKFEEV